MEKWAWEELAAQVEEHGYSAVQFYLDRPEEGTGELQDIDVADVGYDFEDNQIKVVLVG